MPTSIITENKKFSSTQNKSISKVKKENYSSSLSNDNTPLLEKILEKIHKPSSTSRHTYQVNHKATPKNRHYKYDRLYVEKNLIAYIGNKRRLLDLILTSVKEVETRGNTPVSRSGLFVDYFAGTGVVSRLMKSLGFTVIANDWEYYSYCLNRGFLECAESDLSLFDNQGGISQVLKRLNSLKKEISGNDYISKYYCPEDDNAPNPEHERIFYTRQNGILIDNIRSTIDRLYGNTPLEQKKKDLLLALLLVQSSKRSNTSGVFKGFHHGFGGKKKDALSRIMSPVALECPQLSTLKNHSIATCYDALHLSKLLKNTQAEIVYLDPPYNQHQYGSNYHLLNTIARNDRPEINKDFWVGGKKVNKSAIRKDWTRTKSKFCYLKTAKKEFTQLISNINSKYILTSYSNEGIIPLEDMIHILSTKGKIAIITCSYVRYRGGRQSNHTRVRNIEFVLMVDTSSPSTPQDIKNVKAVFLSSSLQNLFSEFMPIPILSYQKNLSPSLASASLVSSESGFTLTLPNFFKKIQKGRPCLEPLILRVNNRLLVNQDDIDTIRKLNFSEQQKIITLFSSILIRPNHIKVGELYDILTNDKYNQQELDREFLYREFKRYYGKVNFRKNPELEETLNAQYKKLQKTFSFTKKGKSFSFSVTQ